MSLTMRVISHHAAAMGAAAVMEFAPAGGVIGRAAGSDWVLPDPEKYVSSTHAQIVCENGSWFLTDASTNGTYLNDTQRPIGRGAPVRLNDGDHLYVGEYEIVISLAPAAGAMTSPPSVPGYAPDPFAGPQTTPPPPGPQPDPFGAPYTTPPVAPADPFGVAPQDVDPLAALDRAAGHQTGPQSDWSQGQMADHGPIAEDQMDIPSQKQAIPDNWDATQYGNQQQAAPAPQQGAAPGGIPDNWDATQYGDQQVPPAPAGGGIPDGWDQTGYAGQQPPQQPMPPAGPATIPPMIPPASPATSPPTMPPPMPGPTQTVEAPQFTQAPVPPGGDASALQLLLSGAGMDPSRVPPEMANYLMQLSGQIFREVVQGMMDVLTARASLKNEFRIALTTIKPVQNNPLKFSINVDAALENLLLRSGEGYLEPVEAVREGFDDIKAHQMSMIAGMRAAFNALLERLAPEELTGQFDRSTKRGLLSVSGKGRYWEAYTEMMEQLAADPDTSFRELFGNEFARAYEEQMARLTSQRR